MIEGLLVLLSCQLVGTGLVDWLGLKLPGPVMGMLLLLGLLFWRGVDDDAPVMRAGARVLDELPLLFIPAGVGLVGCIGLLQSQWLPISVTMVTSWAGGLLATVAVAGMVTRLFSSPADDLEDEAAELVDQAELIEGLERDLELADGRVR